MTDSSAHLFHFKAPCDKLASPESSRIITLILKSAICNLNSPLPCSAAYSRLPGNRTWVSLGSHYSASHKHQLPKLSREARSRPIQIHLIDLWQRCKDTSVMKGSSFQSVVKQQLDSFILKTFQIYLLLLEGEEGEEREKHCLIVSHMLPDRGSNLQLRYVPWPEIEPPTFSCTRWRSSQLSHTGHGWTVVFWKTNLDLCLSCYTKFNSKAIIDLKEKL